MTHLLGRGVKYQSNASFISHKMHLETLPLISYSNQKNCIFYDGLTLPSRWFENKCFYVLVILVTFHLMCISPHLVLLLFTFTYIFITCWVPPCFQIIDQWRRYPPLSNRCSIIKKISYLTANSIFFLAEDSFLTSEFVFLTA